jgi:hypothetical protein
MGGAAGLNIMTGSASQPHFDLGNNGVVMQEDDIINFVREKGPRYGCIANMDKQEVLIGRKESYREAMSARARYVAAGVKPENLQYTRGTWKNHPTRTLTNWPEKRRGEDQWTHRRNQRYEKALGGNRRR